MLNQGNKYLFICLLLVGCSCNSPKTNNNFLVKSKSNISEGEYKKLYIAMCDSVLNFQKNSLQSYDFLNSGDWWIDSLLCLNAEKSRLISCVLSSSSNFKNDVADGIQFMYGEKISGEWYFFKGASIVIPRSMVKNQPINQPLSYQQLHQIALKEVYGGYLLPNGEINEAWFTAHFEGPGWGTPNYKNATSKEDSVKIKKKYYQTAHARQHLRLWVNQKRTCGLYKTNDLVTELNVNEKKLKLKLPVKSFDTLFMYNDYYYLKYKLNNNFVSMTKNIDLEKNTKYIIEELRNIPQNGKIEVIIYLSEIGPLTFLITIENNIITEQILKDCELILQ